ALPLARAALSIAEEIEHAQWQVAALRVVGELQLDLLQPDGARATLERGLAIAKETKSTFWIAALSACLSRALIAVGEIKTAKELLAPLSSAQRLVLADWLVACAEAELALATGNYTGVLEQSDRLERAVWPADRCSRLTLLRVEALLGLKQLDEALASATR